MVIVNKTMGGELSTQKENNNNVGILGGGEEDDAVYEIYLEVSVTNPITRKDKRGNYITTYAIYIETNDSAFTMSKSMVRRRFSDFVALRSILRDQHPALSVPKLPGKTLLGKRFDQPFIEERCQSLQTFLKAIVDQPVYLSNKSLHMFLQTSLSMNQVRKVVNEGVSFECPIENVPLVLRAVDNKKPSGRVGILKQESCASLASCPDRECMVKAKHQHMRVGSGIVVCPYQTNADVASSAPFNIPGSHSPKNALRSYASDTCLDGANNSLTGSKKKVSFFIEKENKTTVAKPSNLISPEQEVAVS